MEVAVSDPGDYRGWREIRVEYNTRPYGPGKIDRIFDLPRGAHPISGREPLSASISISQWRYCLPGRNIAIIGDSNIVSDNAVLRGLPMEIDCFSRASAHFHFLRAASCSPFRSGLDAWRPNGTARKRLSGSKIPPFFGRTRLRI